MLIIKGIYYDQIRKNTLVAAGTMMLGLSTGGSATAAPIFYFDAAAFNSALSGVSSNGFSGTVETFDTLASGSKGTGFTAPSGIGFSTSTADTELRVNAAAEPSTSGLNALAQRFTGAGGPIDEQFGFGTVLDIDLSTTTNAFSATLINNLSSFLASDLVIDVNGTTGNIAGASNTLIPGSTASFAFIGVIDEAMAFSDLTMTFDTTETISIGELDDVTYYNENTPATSPIPVPAALPLLLCGIGALVMIRRRKT
ncbi:VPLPA-CTERM sorting domain-containing protein [Roseovarius sp.]|uniref:VPLPA-CTERM sorting domain-containing protein n=1 Tax=Roseovarius sp. TaxID=1486281 RepID=UPI00356A28AA